MAAFNASVAALAEERWAANGAVAELELQVCRLALDVETTSRKGEAEENALCDALAAARRDHKEAVKALSYFRRVLDATSEAFEALSNEDKAHEKNFRREFAEVGMEYYEELSRLYKRRGPRPADDAQGDKPPQKLGSRRMSMGMGKDPAMQQVKQRMKRASQYGRMSAIRASPSARSAPRAASARPREFLRSFPGAPISRPPSLCPARPFRASRSGAAAGRRRPLRRDGVHPRGAPGRVRLCRRAQGGPAARGVRPPRARPARGPRPVDLEPLPRSPHGEGAPRMASASDSRAPGGCQGGSGETPGSVCYWRRDE